MSLRHTPASAIALTGPGGAFQKISSSLAPRRAGPFTQAILSAQWQVEHIEPHGLSMRPRNRKPPLAIVDAPLVEPPSPLRVLGPTGLDLWSRVQAEFVITDVGGVELLQQCCECADLVQELSECVARDGKMVSTKSGLRANPLLRDLLSARAFLVNGLKKLGLTAEPIGRIGRPAGPRWRGNVD